MSGRCRPTSGRWCCSASPRTGASGRWPSSWAAAKELSSSCSSVPFRRSEPDWVMSMPDRTDDFNDLVDELLRGRVAAEPADPELAGLVHVAADLLDLPRETFRDQLRAEL